MLKAELDSKHPCDKASLIQVPEGTGFVDTNLKAIFDAATHKNSLLRQCISEVKDEFHELNDVRGPVLMVFGRLVGMG